MEETNFELVLSGPFGLSPSQVLFVFSFFCFLFRSIISFIMVNFLNCWIKVSVVFDPSYDRIAHPDIELENSISEVS